MGRGKKGPMKITYSIQGRPIDLESMHPDERRDLSIKLNDIAMKAIGYERVPAEKQIIAADSKR